MSPSEAFYARLREDKTFRAGLNVGEWEKARLNDSSEFIEQRSLFSFFTEIKTAKGLTLTGLLDMGIVNLGEGYLRIPFRADSEKGYFSEEESYRSKAYHGLVTRNSALLRRPDFKKYDFTFLGFPSKGGQTQKIGDISLGSGWVIGWGDYLNIHRGVESDNSSWRKLPRRNELTPELLVNSAMGLVSYLEQNLRWKIKPLSAEVIEKAFPKEKVVSK